MDVGVLMVFQNYKDQLNDQDSFKRDLMLACDTEALGFDWISAVEHHFFNYAMMPDNVQLLSYIAARTRRIKLMTGAVILPWNDPLRVVEKMIMLDHLSDGRALFGIGRGLAKKEYDRFKIDMNEAKGRFEEAAEIILRGLETGIVSGEGEYYRFKPTEVRPRPYASFKGRFNCVSTSSDTISICTRLGGRMMSFASKPWEELVPHIEQYRSEFLQIHGTEAPKPMCIDNIICDENPAVAEDLARKYISNYFITVMEIYDMLGDHFQNTQGYSDYANNAALIKQAGLEMAAEGFVKANVWGTPDQILAKLDERRQYFGDFDLMINISFGGLPADDARRSLETFASKVLPELKSW